MSQAVISNRLGGSLTRFHAGVKIPKFEQLHTGGENTKISLTGLGSGGQQIQTCRKAFMNSIELLVQLASLQTAFLTLDEAIKTTNRRVNALDNVVRPKLENTISYIKVGKQHHHRLGQAHNADLCTFPFYMPSGKPSAQETDAVHRIRPNILSS